MEEAVLGLLSEAYPAKQVCRVESVRVTRVSLGARGVEGLRNPSTKKRKNYQKKMNNFSNLNVILDLNESDFKLFILPLLFYCRCFYNNSESKKTFCIIKKQFFGFFISVSFLWVNRFFIIAFYI